MLKQNNPSPNNITLSLSGANNPNPSDENSNQFLRLMSKDPKSPEHKTQGQQDLSLAKNAKSSALTSSPVKSKIPNQTQILPLDSSKLSPSGAPQKMEDAKPPTLSLTNGNTKGKDDKEHGDPTKDEIMSEVTQDNPPTKCSDLEC